MFSAGHDKRIYMKTLNEDDIRKQEEYIYCDREDYLGEARPNSNTKYPCSWSLNINFSWDGVNMLRVIQRKVS